MARRTRTLSRLTLAPAAALAALIGFAAAPAQAATWSSSDQWGTYDVTVPSSGAYNTSYDIWDSDYDYEVMLWVNHNGAVGPLGTSQGTLSLGGHTWTVYKGDNGSDQVFSFLRTSDSASGTVDVLPILKWIKDTKGWWGNETIGDVQFGYEITSSAGGPDFRTNAFAVSAS